MEEEYDIVKRVLRFRAKHSMSMKDFAAVTSLTKQTVWRLEHRKGHPTALTIAKIESIIEMDKEFEGK